MKEQNDVAFEARIVAISWAYVFSSAVYGFVSGMHLSLIDPQTKAVSHGFLYIATSGIPWLAFVWLLKSLRIPSTSKYYIWLAFYTLMYHGHIWTHVWPYILRGFDQVLLITNGGNWGIFSITWAIVAVPRRLLLATIIWNILLIWSPYFWIVSSSKDSVVRQVATIDGVFAGSLGFIAGMLVDNILVELERLRALQLRQSELIHRVSRQVAHDIRSPLAALNAIREKTTGLSDIQRQILSQVVGRVHGIASDLLSLTYFGNSDLDDGKYESRRLQQPVLVAPAVVNLINEKLISLHAGHRVDLSLILEPNTLTLTLDTDLDEFYRASSNLIENSITAALKNKLIRKPSCCVTLRADPSERSIILDFFDSGPGFKETSPQHTGHGLGLKQVESFLLLVGGTCERIETPEGTTVRVIIPAGSPPKWAARSINVIANHTIVIVDDDDSHISLLIDKLRTAVSATHKIRAFNSPNDERLLNLIREVNTSNEKFQFFIDSSYRVPTETSGIDLCKKIARPELTTFITSEHNSESLQRYALTSGAKIMPKECVLASPIKTFGQ